MSDVMLFGVLRMPYEMAMGDELSRRQFWDRAQQAADEITRLRAENERMREEAVFALDRIRDWESDYLTDDQPDGAVRDWLGHVSPSLERLRALTEPTKEIGNDPL